MTPTKPLGVPLPAWEDLEPDNFVHVSTLHPRPSKKNKPDNNKRTVEDVSIKKIRLADGRTTYLL